MRPIRIAVCLAALAAMVIIQSCGSSNTGGTVLFNTVNASVSVDPAKNPLLSDLATWTGTPCDPASTPTIKNDVINFNVVSTVNISNGTSSRLILQRATITFTPADTLTPVLPALYSPTYISFNYPVPAGGSFSVPIELASHLIKDFLFVPLVCTTGSIYTYNTTVSFEAVEENTGKTGVITAHMTVRFADFAD